MYVLTVDEKHQLLTILLQKMLFFPQSLKMTKNSVFRFYGGALVFTVTKHKQRVYYCCLLHTMQNTSHIAYYFLIIILKLVIETVNII